MAPGPDLSGAGSPRHDDASGAGARRTSPWEGDAPVARLVSDGVPREALRESPFGPIDVAWLVLVLVIAGALRAVHIDAASLWWDELVEIQTAALPRFVDVLWRVRRGDPPGLGNAGAVPLDYLLMHAYLLVAPRPSLAGLEVFYRFPSWLFSTAAVGAVFLAVRRFFGRPAACLSSLVLALSVPHALYAGEARFYSLFTFVTVLCLWAFSRVVENPRRPLAWIVHSAVGLTTVLTGLLGVLLLAGQYAILAGLVPWDRSVARRDTTAASGGRELAVPLAIVGGSFAAFALVLWRFYRGTWLFLRLQHDGQGGRPWQAATEVLSYFALEPRSSSSSSLCRRARMVRRDRTRLAISLHHHELPLIPVIALLAT